MQKTSLGRMFFAQGVPNWEEMFPKEICGKCCLESQCDKGKNCAAIIIIGALGATAIVTETRAQVFAKDLKKSIDAIHKD